MAAQLAVTGHRPNEAPPRRSATEGGRRNPSAAFSAGSGAAAPNLRPQQPPPPRCQRGERPAQVNRTVRKYRSRYGSVQTEQSEEIIHTWIFCIDFQSFQIHSENFSQKIDLFRSLASCRGQKRGNMLSIKQYASAKRRKGPRSAPRTHAEYQRNNHLNIQFSPYTIP